MQCEYCKSEINEYEFVFFRRKNLDREVDIEVYFCGMECFSKKYDEECKK